MAACRRASSGLGFAAARSAAARLRHPPPRRRRTIAPSTPRATVRRTGQACSSLFEGATVTIAAAAFPTHTSASAGSRPDDWATGTCGRSVSTGTCGMSVAAELVPGARANPVGGLRPEAGGWGVGVAGVAGVPAVEPFGVFLAAPVEGDAGEAGEAGRVEPPGCEAVAPGWEAVAPGWEAVAPGPGAATPCAAVVPA